METDNLVGNSDSIYLDFENVFDKWQDKLLGPAQGFEKTLHTEHKLKNKTKEGHNGNKIGASNIFWGNQLRFRI